MMALAVLVCLFANGASIGVCHWLASHFATIDIPVNFHQRR
jgi:hypothetical protein